MIYVTEEMLSSGQPIAQGEVLIWSKKHAPTSVLKGLAALQLSDVSLSAELILGHSETGHHHVLVCEREPLSQAAQALIDAANDTFVELRLRSPCVLKHQRAHDTHEAIMLPPGEYIRGIREEQVPEGWRRVAD